ncbi:hypothetical protein [Desulforamulus aquiferis]|uniref:Uncharacterized protein n=1 Tax=Desulforamulus aquiferis TaxID=1397668 RepID=A0AAW7ZHW0_9FIRM|nr:hypothetical protein [Desulforamulus aquiferis]MDO7788943.1 hypothetical protein [Desulforamulus aquiferis]RYD03204.1 hypothetical protein N752_20415 [Desulforamulus aquiferis]
MAFPKLGDLIDEYNEIKGSITYKLDDRRLLDKSVPEIVFCDKTVGKSHFSLVRTPEFEMVFTYKKGNKTHQSRIDLNDFNPSSEARFFLSWGPDHCEICWTTNPGCCCNF